MDTVSHCLQMGYTSAVAIGEGGAVPCKRQAVLAESAVNVGATVPLQVEGAERIASIDGLQQVWIDSRGIVKGVLEGVGVSVVDCVEEVDVVGGIDFQVEGLQAVARVGGEEVMEEGACLTVGRVNEKA